MRQQSAAQRTPLVRDNFAFRINVVKASRIWQTNELTP
jgi:hypothetical protein